MSIGQSLLSEFDYEMASTRTTLERVPDDKLAYKPDPKSMSMGQLAGHIAEMVGFGAATMATETISIDHASHKPYIPANRAQLLAELDKNVAATRAALASASDQAMMVPWTLNIDGKPLFTMPRIAVLRTMIMNHVIHHRAQLTVYFRLNGIPVPPLYGPSADEGSPAAASA